MPNPAGVGWDTSPGFAAMLKRIESNGVRTIIVAQAMNSYFYTSADALVPSCAGAQR
jgi:hypothetical protein